MSDWAGRNASWLLSFLIACAAGVTSWQVSLAQMTSEVNGIQEQVRRIDRRLELAAQQPPSKMSEVTREALRGLALGQQQLQEDIREVRALVLQSIKGNR